MYYTIPAAHVETFESFFNRLTLWEDFPVLYTSPDSGAPPTTAEMWVGFVTEEYIPSDVSDVMRIEGETRRTVLLSSCKTMLIAYRSFFEWYEVTLYRERSVSCIESIFDRYRTVGRQSIRQSNACGSYSVSGLC